MSDIAWCVGFGALVLVWWHGRGIKDAALRATRRHCDELDLQLLDESLVLRSIRLGRDPGGWPRLRRRYSFEFSATGDERYSGETLLLGRRVQRIELPPHRNPEL
nr:DUF3301 domain-containing protein [Motiliproteus sediminis]